MNALAALPAKTLDLCLKELPAAPFPNLKQGDIARLIVDLDHPEYTVRVKSMETLMAAGEFIDQPVRKALASQVSLEQQRRLERILDHLATRLPLGQDLRAVRAVELVETFGTPEARKLLRSWSTGAPHAFLTQHARAALGRLEK